MTLQSFTDTIAAISTPIGVGGISIIRISGSLTKTILFKLCTVSNIDANQIKFSRFLNTNNSIVDEGLISYFKAPHSYTGEDIAEVNCHGGYITAKIILDTIICHGARLADKGEFTQRAFINGKLDLPQAESIIDIIESKTEKSSSISVNQLEGNLSKKIRDIRKQLLDTIAHLEVHLDYPEDEELETHQNYLNNLKQISNNINKLLDTYQTGRIYREGVLTVIIGKPNAGKSSLLNTLLEDNRAIVSAIPGTTRDTIEEWIQLEGIPFKLVDTAGLRETQSSIEQIGIDKAKNFLEKSDIQIIILDAETGIENEDKVMLKNHLTNNSVIIINKCDLKQRKVKEITKYLETQKFIHEVNLISVLKNDGIKSLIKKLTLKAEYLLGSNLIKENNTIISNDRQKEKLLKANESIKNASQSISRNMPEDFWLIDLKDALTSLGEISGESVSDEVLSNIFSRFCVGK